MKYFVVLAVVLVSAYGLDKEFIEKFREQVMKIGEECMKEVGASSDDLEEIIEKKIPNSHEGKCLLACGHKKFGIQGADGKIDLPSAIASLNDLKEADADVYAKMKQMFETCIASISNDPDECVTAANWMECIHKESHKNGLAEVMKV